MRVKSFLLAFSLGVFACSVLAADRFQKLSYNRPDLKVDLGAGLSAWPLPIDFNKDGRLDLVIVCTSAQSKGTYYFANTGETDQETNLPIFRKTKTSETGTPWPQVSYVNGAPIVTARGMQYPDFVNSAFAHPEPISASDPAEGRHKTRANQWKYVDFDGDGKIDIVVGIDDWSDYGDISPEESQQDEKGNWKRGPLRGYVYMMRNVGADERTEYAPPIRLTTLDGKPVETRGQPSPNFVDFDNDGDLDLLCGEFVDGFTYFENVGTRTEPRYARGKPLKIGDAPLRMDLCIITPTVVDFDGDGIPDIVCGQEDGRVALLKGTGKRVDGVPQFLEPRFFSQYADDLKFGVLASPVSVDWDGDGLEDLIVGNSAGYVGFVKNLGGLPPRWDAPVYLEAEGRIIREQAGDAGSVQGPIERKWGYANPSVVDWDCDGRPDLIVNGIWGRVLWYRNIGTRTKPALAKGVPIEVAWPGATPKPAWTWWTPQGKELIVQWRSTALGTDFDGDGLADLVTLDPEGYLVLYRRRRSSSGDLELLPPRRHFRISHMIGVNRPLRITAGTAGHSGRRTFCFVDWDRDGKTDLLLGGGKVDLYRNVETKESEWIFRKGGSLDPSFHAPHNMGVTVVRWRGKDAPDLLVGSEDGYFYYLKNPNAPKSADKPTG